MMRKALWLAIGLFIGSLGVAIGQFGGDVAPATFLGNVGGTRAPAAAIPLSHAFSFANLQQLPAYTYPCNNTASLADMQSCAATAPTAPLYTDGATIWIHQGAWVGNGPVPTPSGTCTVSAQGGGTTVGRFTAAACAAGTIILTFNVTGMAPTPSGWSCSMDDQTTTAAVFKQTANTATSVTFTNSGSASVNGDAVTFRCQGMQ
jgi:hypothetical protein